MPIGVPRAWRGRGFSVKTRFPAVSRLLAEGPFPGFHGRRAWPGLAVHLYRRREFAGHRLSKPDAHVFILVRAGRGRLDRGEGPNACAAVLVAGSIIFVPAGAPALWSGTLPDCIAVTVESARPARTAAGDDAGSSHEDLVHIADGRDPFVEQIACLLAAEVERPIHGADRVLWLSARQALRAHLARAYVARRAPAPRACGLADAKLARVVDFVDAHIDGSITLDQMAGVAEMGRFHFARMFKRCVGITPMTYVEHARVEHAKTLLQRGGLSLAQVATCVGFADQSHFTRRFRRHTGLTPAVFARRIAAGMPATPAQPAEAPMMAKAPERDPPGRSGAAASPGW